MGGKPADKKLGEASGDGGEIRRQKQRVFAHRAGEKLQPVVHRGGTGCSSKHKCGQTCENEISAQLRFKGIVLLINSFQHCKNMNKSEYQLTFVFAAYDDQQNFSYMSEKTTKGVQTVMPIQGFITLQNKYIAK